MQDDFSYKLATLLSGYTSVSQMAVKNIFESGEVHAIPKNEIIINEKRYNAYEYFQLTGVSHRYNKNEDDEIITTGLYSGPTVYTPHFARTINNQSIFSVQALIDCEVLKVPIGVFDDLRREHSEIWHLGQRIVEKEFIQNLNQEILFRSHSAKDRLIDFRGRYQHLENVIPHTVIASFLGITAVSFSRLRNELAKI